MTYLLHLHKSQPQSKPAAAGMARRGTDTYRGDYLRDQGILSRKQATALFSWQKGLIHVPVMLEFAHITETPLASFCPTLMFQLQKWYSLCKWSGLDSTLMSTMCVC